MNIKDKTSEVNDLISEIQMMRGLSHKHIVEYIGSYVDSKEITCEFPPCLLLLTIILLLIALLSCSSVYISTVGSWWFAGSHAEKFWTVSSGYSTHIHQADTAWITIPPQQRNHTQRHKRWKYLGG